MQTPSLAAIDFEKVKHDASPTAGPPVPVTAAPEAPPTPAPAEPPPAPASPAPEAAPVALAAGGEDGKPKP
ncbi:MAG: hypothetical protein QM765_24830 [Myxococcales bacterium]